MKESYEKTIYECEKTTKNGDKLKVKVKFNRIAFGLLLIACAVIIILDTAGIGLAFLSGVPSITLIIGALLLLWFLSDLVKLRISRSFFPLAFLFILFEKHIAGWLKLESENIMNNWFVLLVLNALEPILVTESGISIVVSDVQL